MTPDLRVVLDAAAGPLSPAAREALLAAVDEGWADPRRLHAEGRRASALLEGAREAVAGVLGARTEEVSFTSSHHEALSLAVRGAAAGRRRVGPTVVTSAVEHSGVLLTAGWLAARGLRHEVVGVDARARVDAAAFGAAVGQEGVALAALQAANGEVGTRQPLPAAYDACRAAGVPLVVDTGSVLGRDPVPATWDVLAGDARSWGGPPGCGVLAVRAGTRWRADWPADEAERGRVPGGMSVPVALSAAAALLDAHEHRQARAARAHAAVDRLRAAAALVPDTEVVGDPVDRLPHVVTFSCLYADGEALVGELDRRGYAVASGSACTASTLEPSHVLAAMGALTHGNVRVTLPLEVTDEVDAGVDRLCAELPDAVAAVRRLLGSEGL